MSLIITKPRGRYSVFLDALFLTNVSSIYLSSLSANFESCIFILQLSVVDVNLCVTIHLTVQIGNEDIQNRVFYQLIYWW